MDSILVSLFLEELVYESDEGALVQVILDCIEERGFSLDLHVKKTLWPLIRSRSDVNFVTPTSSYESMVPVSLMSVPSHWDPGVSNDTQLNFSQFKVVASMPLRLYVLDAGNHPEIFSSSVHMRILSAIASKRYKGVSQIQLCETFKSNPKWLFQYLKVFYKYDMIVRRQLPVTASSNSSRNITNSHIFWLKRFFDIQRIPYEMLKVLKDQKRLPIKVKVLELLRERSGNLALEEDIREFCLQLLYKDEESGFSLNPRTASREYMKLRNDLIESKQVAPVQAFCPQRDCICDCLALYEVTRGYNTGSSLSPPHADQSDEGLQHDHNNLRRTPPPLPTTLHTKTEEGEEEGVPHARLAATRYTVVDATTLSIPCNHVNASPSTQSQTNGERDGRAIFMVYELPIYEQVLCLIHGMLDKGVLSTEISAVLGITAKQLTRLLQNLEAAQFICRSGQRLGKHFIYRFLSKQFSSSHKPQHPTVCSPHEDIVVSPGSANATVKEENVCHDVERPSATGRAASHLGLYTLKTQTQQFRNRLGWVKETIEEMKACSLKELARVIAVKENNNGPDRKTVLRLLDHAVFEDPRIQKTLLSSNSTDPIKIYYCSTSITAHSAQEKVKHNIAERRVQGMKLSTRYGKSVPYAIEPKVEGDTSGSHTTLVTSQCDKHQQEEDHNTIGTVRMLGEPTRTPHRRHSGNQRILLPHVNVVSRLTLDIEGPEVLWFADYDVVTVGTVFHSHVLDIVYGSLRAVAEEKGAQMEEIDSRRLSTVDILKRMSIETFFQTIGCGYRHPYMDDIFRHRLDITVFHTLDELPTEVYNALLFSSYRGWRPSQKQLSCSSSGAVVSADRLLQRLVTMKCVRLCCEKVSGAPAQCHTTPSGSGNDILWDIYPRVTLEPFFCAASAYPSTGTLQHFHVIRPQDFEAFWKQFKNEVDRWIMSTKSVASYATPQMDRTLYPTLNSLFHLDGRSSVARGSLTEDSGRRQSLTASHIAQIRLPDNMPLPVAFSKRNWTAKLLLSPAMREELQNFALSLLKKYRSTRPAQKHSPPTTVSQIPTSAVLCNPDVESSGLLEESKSTSSHATPELLSSQTPCVRHVAEKLKLPPDAVIRYLLRFFNPKLDPSFSNLPFFIYTGREARYCCHICNAIYFQKPSLVHHYSTVHQTSVEDIPDVLCDERPLTWSSPSRSPCSTPLEYHQDSPLDGDDNTDMISSADLKENPPQRSAVEDLEEWTLVGNVVSAFRKDDTLQLIGFSVIAQRLYNSMFPANKQDPLVLDHVAHYPPSSNHRLWTMMSELPPTSSPFYGSPTKCRTALLLLMNKNMPFYLRVLRAYSRSPPYLLMQCLHRGEVPPVLPAVARHHHSVSRHTWVSCCFRDASFESRCQTIRETSMCETVLKTVMFSSFTCYRPHWAVEAARFIREDDMSNVIYQWNVHNWIVKAKATFERWTPVQRLMDLSCRRKYYISHHAQQHLFRKRRDYHWTRELLLSLNQLDSVHAEYISEPCRASCLFAVLEKVAHSALTLDMAWCRDAVRHDNHTSLESETTGDQRGFIHDGQVRDPGSLSPSPTTAHQVQCNHVELHTGSGLCCVNDQGTLFWDAYAGGSQHAVCKALEEPQELGESREDTTLREPPQESMDTPRDTCNPYVAHRDHEEPFDESVHFPFEEDGEEDPGIGLMKLLLQDLQNTSPYHEQGSDATPRPTQPHSFTDVVDELEEVPLFHDDLLALDVKHRVVARAVEGGLEKHITELTGSAQDISIHPVSYTVVQTPPLNLLKFGPPLYPTPLNGPPCNFLLGGSRHRRNGSLKLFLPCPSLLCRVGCSQRSDYPDPLLFCNVTLSYFVVQCVHDLLQPTCPPHRGRCVGNPVDDIISVYEDDVVTGWQWGAMTPTPQLCPYHLPRTSTKERPTSKFLSDRLKTFFLSSITTFPTSYSSSMTVAQRFLLDTVHTLTDCSPLPSPSSFTVTDLLHFLYRLLPHYPTIHRENVGEAQAYMFLFFFLTTIRFGCFTWKEYVVEWTTNRTTMFPEPNTASNYIACFSFIHQTVVNAAEYGISREHLKKAFNNYNKRGLSNFFSAYSTQEDPHSALFTTLLDGLELLRVVVRVPRGTEWLFVASPWANQFCIAKRALLGIQRPSVNPEQDVLLSSDWIQPITSLGGLDETLTWITPKRIWALWGPPSECHWDSLMDAVKHNRTNHFLNCLPESYVVLLLLRTFFLSCTMFKSDALLNPVPSTLIPCCAWIQLDGHLNASLLVLLITHLFFLFETIPGATVHEVVSCIPLFHRCEIAYILEALCEEDLLHQRPSANAVQYFRRHPTPELFLTCSTSCNTCT